MAKKIVLFIEDNEIVAAEDEHGNRLEHSEVCKDKFKRKAQSLSVKTNATGKCCGWRCIKINGDEIWTCIQWC